MSQARDPVAARARRRQLRRRRQTLQALAGAGLLVLVGTLAWALWPGGSSRTGARTATMIGGGPHRGSHATHRERPAPVPTGRPVTLTADLTPAAPAVAQDFLGLSFEVADLPRLAGYAGRGNLVTLLRSLGTGVMRFGGNSADETAAWTSARYPLPSWATTAVTAADLANLARLARATGWRVLLTLNLGHPDAARAAEEAAVAQAQLGSSLSGLQVGNEPDAYMRRHQRGPGWSFAAYRAQLEEYRRALATAAPGVPLTGPDASSGLPVLPWVRQAAASVRPALLTDHYYPLTSCGYQPAVSDLLDPRTRSMATTMLGDLATISRGAQLPLRLDETNSISCRGQRGVSNSFASALWAADYTLRAIAAGLNGVNFHSLVGETLSYTPLAVADQRGAAAGALQAKPEFYALLLARRLLGDRPVRASVRGAGGALSAGALISPRGRLHLVLVNFEPPGAQPLLVRLRVPARFGSGPILRLTGPAPAATSGVRLGGRRVRANGSWTPEGTLPRVYAGPGGLALSVAPSSAALVTLLPAG